MRPFPWLLVAALFIILGSAVAIFYPAGSAVAASGRSAPTCFSPVPGPNPGSTGNTLADVSAVSGTSIWAVGYTTTGGGSSTLITHWDGGMWTQEAGPNPGNTNRLNSVYAVSATEAWAVGSTDGAVLLLHFQAGAWTQVASSQQGSLNAVQGLTTTDIWAAGQYDDHLGVEHAVILHWDGAGWSQVGLPPLVGNNILYGISPLSANDVWAVGTSYRGSNYMTLLLHWDGSVWSQVASPDPGTAGSLYAVVALSPGDVWAIGSTGNQTLTLHWDGTAWSQVASPNPGSLGNVLYGASGTSTGDVWGVGEMDTSGGPQSLILHWDGASWSQVASPNPSQTVNILNSVAALDPNIVWAVGYLANGFDTNTLILSSCTTPTATVTPSATPCAATFSDVHPDDYFAEPVRYLACRRIVGGYGDGTFRPYSMTTRSQMVKMVVLGFGVPNYIPPGGAYTFADVLPTHPFYPYVEAAAHANIISGYTCGGPGEPCDSQQRPYFRPGAGVTRGQLSKITVEAAGWDLINPSSPTFADSLPGNPFYPFVETAACRRIISGYACGGPGEPCDADQRPYFRPTNNATRGQIAKILVGALTSPSSCASPHP